MAYPSNVRVEDDRIIITLPNDPLDGSAREAEIESVIWRAPASFIQVTLGVYWLDENGERISDTKRKMPYEVILKATRDIWVNQYGQVVPQDDPTAVMTEYDFYVAAFQSEQILFEVLALAAVDAITSNRYDI